ncbi:MAG: hypothetical protein ACOC1F_05290 [Myxococcota bacterium]
MSLTRTGRELGWVWWYAALKPRPIEEKCGKRPDLNAVRPTIELDGMTPKIGINGLTAEHLGKLDMEEVTSETARRTAEWLSKASTLMVWAPSTSSALSFQAAVLDAIVDGFERGGVPRRWRSRR